MQSYEDALNELKAILEWGEHNEESASNPGPTIIEIQNARNAVHDAYNHYIITLIAAQKEESKRKGEIA
jgi:hypothetical protein